MRDEKVAENLLNLLAFEELEDLAREHGALKRQRKLHPVRMLEGMLKGRGEEAGYLSGALLYLRTVYQLKVDRSSFYQRLTTTYAAFVRAMAERVLKLRIASSHPELTGRLEALKDLWAYDSTTIRLRQKLVEHFSSGGKSPQAGLKIHTGLSLRSGALISPKVTPEAVADVKAIDIADACEDVLVLLDRGYSAHDLFAQVEKAGGFYLTRLKAGVNPEVLRIDAAGFAAAAAVTEVPEVPCRLNDALEQGAIGFDAPVDLQVRLRMRRAGAKATQATQASKVGKVAQAQPDALSARVVGVPRVLDDGTQVTWWYLTNLPADAYDPELIARLYVLRWQVELLFKQLKSYFSIDKMHVLKEHNVRLIIDLSILAYLLSLGIMDACTTPKEREPLSIHMMAKLLPYLMPMLGELIETQDKERRLELAAAIRNCVLNSTRATNPTRSKAAAKNKRLDPISSLIHA